MALFTFCGAKSSRKSGDHFEEEPEEMHVEEYVSTEAPYVAEEEAPLDMGMNIEDELEALCNTPPEEEEEVVVAQTGMDMSGMPAEREQVMYMSAEEMESHSAPMLAEPVRTEREDGVELPLEAEVEVRAELPVEEEYVEDKVLVAAPEAVVDAGVSESESEPEPVVVAEPVVEPVVEPVPEPVVEAVVEPIVEPVVEDTPLSLEEALKMTEAELGRERCLRQELEVEATRAHDNIQGLQMRLDEQSRLLDQRRGTLQSIEGERDNIAGKLNDEYVPDDHASLLASELEEKERALTAKSQELDAMRARMEQMEQEHRQTLATLISQVEETHAAQSRMSQSLLSIAPTLVRPESPIRERGGEREKETFMSYESSDEDEVPPHAEFNLPTSSAPPAPADLDGPAPAGPQPTPQLMLVLPGSPLDSNSQVMHSPTKSQKPSRPGRRQPNKANAPSQQ
ncbi:hypothetical protein KIPB_008715 [Kipferlia bialata]|uniref:Uncharacterized protein n=1 Tax=Kipferlia bialata TaxID=797122 RepID=A0A9K3D3T5_9EUKA|nr:hypothetical protein KIPB_008715 [Kipferlia bialata]|eukprot:g8715.t1